MPVTGATRERSGVTAPTLSSPGDPGGCGPRGPTVVLQQPVLVLGRQRARRRRAANRRRGAPSPAPRASPRSPLRRGPDDSAADAEHVHAHQRRRRPCAQQRAIRRLDRAVGGSVTIDQRALVELVGALGHALLSSAAVPRRRDMVSRRYPRGGQRNAAPPTGCGRHWPRGPRLTTKLSTGASGVASAQHGPLRLPATGARSRRRSAHRIGSGTGVRCLTVTTTVRQCVGPRHADRNWPPRTAATLLASTAGTAVVASSSGSVCSR